MSKRTYSIFNQLGLLSLYIIDESGLPLIVENFDKKTTSEEDNIIITSFSSAITIFAQNMLISFISDIGIFSKRLFFKYQSGFIYLLVFDEDVIHGLTLRQLHELITIAIWQLDIKFKEYYDEVSSTTKRYALPFEIRKNAKFVKELLEKGCRDWLDVNKEKFVVKELIGDDYFEEESLDALVKQLGINAIYLLDRNNNPKFTRIYEPNIPLVTNENIMSQLLTAIGTFTRALLVSYVSDVGMFNQRIFLRYVKPYTFVLIVDDLKFLTESRKNEETIFNLLFNNLTTEFKPRRGRPRKKSGSRRRITTNNGFKRLTDDMIRKTCMEFEDRYTS
jgi:hypothetical protein